VISTDQYQQKLFFAEEKIMQIYSNVAYTSALDILLEKNIMY